MIGRRFGMNFPAPSGFSVRAVKLSTIEPGLALMLDPAEHARAAAIVDAASRADFIAGRVAQRLMAAELLGVAPQNLSAHYWCPECGSGPVPSHGRPGYLLQGMPASVSISFSRSHGWALAAMVPEAGAGLGVDLQFIPSVAFDGFDDVALSPAEKVLLTGVAPGAQDAWRAGVWARKEALAKHSGLGLRSDPRDLAAFPETGAAGSVQDIALPDVEVRDIAPGTVGLPADFAAALAFGGFRGPAV